MGKVSQILILLCGSLLATQGFAQDDGQSGTTGEKQAPPADAEPAPLPEQDDKPVASEGVRPPRLLLAPAPVYPKGRIREGLHPTVMVEIVLDAEGKVTNAKIEHSAGKDFDEAAFEAVRTWSFEPAYRDGKAVSSRLHVAVHFELPAFDIATSEGQVSAIPRVAHPQTHEVPSPHQEKKEARTKDFSATAQVDLEDLRHEVRASSDYTLDRKVLAASPKREGADILQSAPGVFVARPEGDAVAHRIMLRGFDAEHGQDLELKVGGIPINLPSHIHGQGYADLGFLIPEVVERMHVSEGVYDPKQGDFAVAGSVEFDLGAQERGLDLKTSYGSFDTLKLVGVWSPPEENRGTFGAFRYRQSDGFGQNRASQSASSIVQGNFRSGAWRYRATGIVYGARADLAGVLRMDDIDAGRVGYYDVYPYPTAQKQSALAARMLGALRAEYRGKEGQNADLGLWLSYDHFRLQENFTGFVQRSQTLEDVSGRGDLIAQRNRTTSIGSYARFLSAPYTLSSWAKLRTELGISGRMDSINQGQDLIDASLRNQRWDRRIDADILGLDLGFWGDLAWKFTNNLICARAFEPTRFTTISMIISGISLRSLGPLTPILWAFSAALTASPPAHAPVPNIACSRGLLCLEATAKAIARLKQEHLRMARTHRLQKCVQEISG
ncbi:MAG: TonB family protein [Myxococcales bacterium]|nr:MAG: TonB family protein [Myxococcales bacterium]